MSDYLTLSKPRITLMVMVTAFAGYWLAGGRDWGLLGATLFGTALASASTGALNQLLEREQDGLMRRTSGRPLPSGRMGSAEALAFGLACAAAGLTVLGLRVNPLACGLAAFTIASYVLVYTPLKRVSPQSTWVGALAGAMPPLIGWAAARGSLAPQAWALFAIQFLWQIPHFLAIFWIHREDYERAGFRVMPVLDPSGRVTALQVAIHSLALVLASLLPVATGLAGSGYGLGALLLGSAFLALGLRLSWTMELPDARRLFFGSLVYLPAILGMLFAGARS